MIVILQGSTALHKAVQLGSQEIAKLLLANGVDVNAKGYNANIRWREGYLEPDTVSLLLCCNHPLTLQPPLTVLTSFSCTHRGCDLLHMSIKGSNMSAESHELPCPALFCPTLPCSAPLRPATLCPVLLRHAQPYPVHPCPVLPCPALPCPALPTLRLLLSCLCSIALLSCCPVGNS